MEQGGMLNRKAAELIGEIDESGLELNDWENEFVQNMRNWVDQDRDLSPKQAVCLHKIYNKAMEYLEGGTYR